MIIGADFMFNIQCAFIIREQRAFLNKKSGYIEETRGWLCLSFLYKGFRCRRNYRRDFVFFFLRSKYAASSLMPQMADMTKIGIKAIAHRNVMVSFRWYLPV